MKTTKLHELLAVEGNLVSQSKKVLADLTKTFHNKRHLFEQKLVSFQSYREGADSTTESQSDIQTTVEGEFDWISDSLSKAFDASYQVAVTNTKAKADVVLDDGTVVLESVPATALLDLEKKVTEVANLIKSTPTLDPAKGFTPDPTHARSGVFQARPVTKTRTSKQNKVVVLYEATTEHPAQVERVLEDVAVGQISEQEWSGLITPQRKSELINNTENLIRAIRQARSRANEAVVDKYDKVGSKLLKQIFG